MRSLLATLALLLLLAGCSPAVTMDASYGTVVALKDAAVAAGYDCPSWRQENKRGAEEGVCKPRGTDPAQGSDDQFVTFATEADRDAEVRQTRIWGAVANPPWVLLQGPNWLIRGGEDLVELQKRLGGTIIRTAD